jgi:hypothetical protein
MIWQHYHNFIMIAHEPDPLSPIPLTRIYIHCRACVRGQIPRVLVRLC